jgi:hypothetical protein
MAQSESAGPDSVAAELVRAIELSDAFQLCVLAGRWEDLQTVVTKTVERLRALSPSGLVVRWTRSTQQVLEEHVVTQSRSVIVFDVRGPAAAEEFERLNLARDTLRQRGPATLLVLLTDDTESLFAAVAPDLRSVRSVHLRVPMGWPDVEAFQGWVAGCRSAFDAKVASTSGAAELYALGVHSFAYELDHVEDRASVPGLRDAMRSFEGLTGWRPWWVPDNVHPPYAVSQEELECWMLGGTFNDPAHSDFWRASTAGRFYLLRGYAEDSSPDRVRPGQVLSWSLAVWRVAEALLHAEQAAKRFGSGDDWVHFVARWEGLHGRRWSDWPDPWLDDDGTPSSATAVPSSVVCLGNEISKNLPDLVLDLTAPLAGAFLEELSPRAVEGEISKLLKRAAR